MATLEDETIKVMSSRFVTTPKERDEKTISKTDETLSLRQAASAVLQPTSDVRRFRRDWLGRLDNITQRTEPTSNKSCDGAKHSIYRDPTGMNQCSTGMNQCSTGMNRGQPGLHR
ncbi:hypothetical protein DPMN_032306 [Dreissena polymorpha]|uniref:Uncharacterized protein n=1 Tax=Dreissena polymorpha TaxID=45954 RepID=A0A9D4RHU7_DREPO|nr:hypothetical protein DPMN_032306 [Dreissena polymorpha]